MRLSRVLIAGAAVAAAGIATSAFTASNDFTGVDNNVAGYGELVATGVGVTNIAYVPGPDASLLRRVIFTVSEEVGSPGKTARMSLWNGTTATPGSANTCAYTLSGSDHLVTCTLTADVAFTAFTKTGLTVTSN
jgi:hypothetical protein